MWRFSTLTLACQKQLGQSGRGRVLMPYLLRHCGGQPWQPRCHWFGRRIFVSSSPWWSEIFVSIEQTSVINVPNYKGHWNLPFYSRKIDILIHLELFDCRVIFFAVVCFIWKERVTQQNWNKKREITINQTFLQSPHMLTLTSACLCYNVLYCSSHTHCQYSGRNWTEIWYVVNFFLLSACLRFQSLLRLQNCGKLF